MRGFTLCLIKGAVALKKCNSPYSQKESKLNQTCQHTAWITKEEKTNGGLCKEAVECCIIEFMNTTKIPLDYTADGSGYQLVIPI